MASAFKGRREDDRLITGRGRYSDDWDLPGQLYASFKRSDRAHALIRSVSLEAAEQIARRGGDRDRRTILPRPDFAPCRRWRRSWAATARRCWCPSGRILAHDRVRFAGEEVALVVAETRAAARDAADLIEVEYEDLPAVIGFDKALAPGRHRAPCQYSRQRLLRFRVRRRRQDRGADRAAPRMSRASCWKARAWRRTRWSRARRSPGTTPSATPSSCASRIRAALRCATRSRS